MHRRTFLAGLPIPFLGGCLDRYDTPSREGNSTTTPSNTTIATPTGPIEPTDDIMKAKRGDDSVSIQLVGYDSSKFAEAEFFRAAGSTGTLADLSRSQVRSTLQLQNALAYFGPEIEKVSVSMPISDGYTLTNALDSYWNADADARRNEDEEKVYRFEDIQFTVLVVFYE